MKTTNTLMNSKLYSKPLIILFTSLFLTACGGGDSNPTQQTGRDDDTQAVTDNNGDETPDNCPGLDNPLQLDTDNDGNGDACDNDDDGDGFKDIDDPEPLNASVPGDFSTPEAILNDPLMQNAIDTARNKSIDIRTEQGLNPPDLTGYYVSDVLTNYVLTTSDDTDIGRGLLPAESKITSKDGNFIDLSGVAFEGGIQVGFTVETGAIIRGEGNNFTKYSRGKTTCTDGNSDFSIFTVGVTSATLDPSSGDILSAKTLTVTVDTSGDLTPICSVRLVGKQESIGGWSVSNSDIQRKTEVTNLQHMCIDESKAYAPTETWVHSGGTSCSCTEEYAVSCQ